MPEDTMFNEAFQNKHGYVIHVPHPHRIRLEQHYTIVLLRNLPRQACWLHPSGLNDWI
jgi:hypothetical protein